MIEELRKRISEEVQEKVPLARFTTFRIGGPAEYYLEARSAEDVVKAIKVCKELDLPFYVFGGGSNLLINDDGIKGLTIRLANSMISIDGQEVLVGSGTPSGQLARETVEAALGGLEWMIGLPGTVGGAVRGNAGMFGSETKDMLDSVLVFTQEGEAKTMTSEECQFGYRDSIFKRLPGTIILSAKFRLESVDAEKCKEKMQEFLQRKAEHQPVSGLTAGCVFKNWVPKDDKEIETIRKDLDLNKEEEVPRTIHGAVPTGWIIDRAQLKGMAVGHCKVSEKHGNFIVNDGQGRASEVIALTGALKMKIRDMTHGIILLEDEIEYAGF